MFAVFDAHTSLAIATIAATSEADARAEFARTFTGFLGRRLFFVPYQGQAATATRRVAHPFAGLTRAHASTVRSLVNALGIHTGTNVPLC